MRKLSVQSDKAPATEDVCRMLTQLNSAHGVYLDYDRILERRFYYQREKEIWLSKVKAAMGYSSIHDFDVKRLALDFLSSTGLSYYADKTTKGNVSADDASIAKVIDSGMADEKQVRILKIFNYITKCQSMISLLPGILSMGTLVEENYSWEGHRMIRLYPDWVEQNTGRFATRNPAIQNLAHDIQNIITVPNGFRLLHVDSGQIDPRIIFGAIIKDPQIKYLINLYNDAYYGLLHYATQSQEDYLSGRTDAPKREITEEMKRGRSTLKTLGNAVIYGQTSGNMRDPIVKGYFDRIGNHPARKKWQASVEEQIYGGNYIIYTEFDTPVDVRSGSNSTGKYKDASEDAKFKHMVRAGINARVQGTAADLMKFACVEQNQLLQSKWADSYLFLSIHDAIYTAVAEKEWDDLYEPLAHMPEYYVDDWIPIYAEAEEGISIQSKLWAEEIY